MHISVRNTNPNFEYHINDIKLEETKLEKDLGIYVTPNWKSSAHVAKVAARANSMLGRIRHTFTYMNKYILSYFVFIYFLKIKSYVSNEYGSTITAIVLPSIHNDVNCSFKFASNHIFF